MRDYTERDGLEWLRRVLSAPGAQAPTVARAKVLQGVCELSVQRPDSTGEVQHRASEESLAVEGGAIRRGACLLGAADRQGGFDKTWMRLQEDREAYEHSVSAARAALGGEAFATAYAEGQALTLDQAIAYALEEEGE